MDYDSGNFGPGSGSGSGKDHSNPFLADIGKMSSYVYMYICEQKPD